MSVNRTVSSSRSTIAPAPAGQELLDLAEQRGAVADARQVVDALELDVARAGDALGQVARVAHVDEAVVGAVQDQRRACAARSSSSRTSKSVSAAHDAAHLAGAGGEPLQARQPRRAGARRRPATGRGRRAARRSPSARSSARAPLGASAPSPIESSSPGAAAERASARRGSARGRARGARRRP